MSHDKYRVPESLTAAHISASEQAQYVHHNEVTRVLIIYTGGTIGMKNTPRGYAPEPDYLEHKLESMYQFHDPEWADHSSGHVMPMSLYEKRVCWNIIEYCPLLDSSNMDMDDWLRIASDIGKHYHSYDAFVVLHGTDTMSYTASALSFVLENLGKTVVITGSQVPVSEIRNDARENLLGSLTIAGHFVIPEVLLFFNNCAFRGNRTSKMDAIGYNAFDSPNFAPIATAGIGINVAWDAVFVPYSIARFAVHTTLCRNVGAIRLFPGITATTLAAFLQPPMEGVVLETFGAGNAPERADLLGVLRNACNRGVVIVNVTQCAKGIVSDIYAAGRGLTEVGVVCGSDMTAECALGKLSYLLGKGLDVREVRELLKKNMRGELTFIAPKQRFSFLDETFVSAVARALETDFADRKKIADALYPSLLCAAAGSGNLSMIKRYVETSDNPLIVNLTDYDARSPLHVAASGGFKDVVEYLLLKGAFVHAKDRFGHTALRDALFAGHDDVCSLLVQAGATLKDSFDESLAEFPSFVCRAAYTGDLSFICRLVQFGADVFVSNYDGRYPIHFACAANQREVVEYLVNISPESLLATYGPGISCKDEAERYGHRALVDYLENRQLRNE
eukprot:ANDGO_02402.mRNA.1 L-asparaginase